MSPLSPQIGYTEMIIMFQDVEANGRSILIQCLLLVSYISTTHSCYFNKNKERLDVYYCVYLKKIAKQKVPERGKSDVDVQTKGEGKIIVHQEKYGEKK